MPVQVGAFMRQEQYMIKRVPANIETAALSLGVDATQQDWPIITALNTALTAAGSDTLATDKAYMLWGTLEIISGDANPHTATLGNAGTTDGDDTEWAYTTAGAAISYYTKIRAITTDTLNIKAKVDVVAQATLVFHLEAYVEIQPAAE
jgi:hypothetical protein